jgi:hypothetical protein
MEEDSNAMRNGMAYQYMIIIYDLISQKRKLEDSSRLEVSLAVDGYEVAATGIQIQYRRDEDSSLTFFL